jgi:hypothetical protein
MNLRQFICEAPRKPKAIKEPDWPDADAASGYGKLRDIQSRFNHDMGRNKLQLFVPKRRDPAVQLDRERDRRLWAADKDIRDGVKEAIAVPPSPVLTGFSESPPGDNKPQHGFWTSSALSRKNGEYTSDWFELVKKRFPEWQTDYGYLFEVQSNALVFDLEYADMYFEWALSHDRVKTPHRDYNGWEGSRDDMRSRFPWDSLGHHFDGAYCNGHGHYDSDHFTQGWDVESTAWFNPSVLKYKGAVKLFAYGEDDDD